MYHPDEGSYEFLVKSLADAVLCSCPENLKPPVELENGDIVPALEFTHLS